MKFSTPVAPPPPGLPFENIVPILKGKSAPMRRFRNLLI
jgi:hypothetical protein